MKTVAKLLIVSLAGVAACNHDSYDVTVNGLEYKVIMSNDTGARVKENDYLVMDVKYFTPDDSLVFSSLELPGTFRMKSKKPSHGSGCSIDDALLMMREGDSTSFLIDAREFYENTRHDTCPKILIGKKMRFEVALREIQTEQEVQESRQELASRRAREELDLLEAFVQNNYPDARPDSLGMYAIELAGGTGARPRLGQKVSVNYIARLIDGKTLDDTYKREETFSFTLGMKEVIDGLELGLSRQPRGSRYLYLIPSRLAYGAEGNKQIPPCSTIIFEVELVSVGGK